MSGERQERDAAIDSFMDAIDSAYDLAEAAHREGRCHESEWSCSYCEQELLAEARRAKPTCRLGPTEHDGSRFCHEHCGRVHPGSPTPWRCDS